MFRQRKRTSKEVAVAGGKRSRLSKAPMYTPHRKVFCKGAQDKHQPWAALGAWFLGPKAENGDVFRDLLTRAVDRHAAFRQK